MHCLQHSHWLHVSREPTWNSMGLAEYSLLLPEFGESEGHALLLASQHILCPCSRVPAAW